MDAVRITLMCIGAAMICTMLRTHRPEMATIVALAVGVAVFMLSADVLGDVAEGIRGFLSLAEMNGQTSSIVLKAAGIAMLTELGVQICCDAGESALAGRIRLASRLAMLGMAMPIISEITEVIEGILG